jgi:hypothetical protein
MYIFRGVILSMQIPSFYKLKYSFTVVFLSKVCEVLYNCFSFALYFGPQILLLKDFYMAQRGRYLMVLVQDYVVDAAELPTSSTATGPLRLCSIMQQKFSG